MKKENKTSLEKSHSVWSNTKLTLICLLAILAVTAFWGTLTLFNVLQKTICYIILGCSAGLSVLCLLIFNKFKR